MAKSKNGYKRKLWVKVWMTLDGVFDAKTMQHLWENINSPARMRRNQDNISVVYYL